MQRQNPLIAADISSSMQLNINLFSGIFTGTFCSGVMSPVDRALYLAIRNNRQFLLPANFVNPYQGIAQTIAQRALFGGTYYVAQSFFNQHLHPYVINDMNLSDTTADSLVGVAAGGINGLASNSMATIKYYCWNHNIDGFANAAKHMWQNGGPGLFFRGSQATVGRDVIFGSTYETLRHLLPQAKPAGNDQIISPAVQQFLSDTAAAAIASVTSSPLNYARNMQYAAQAEVKPPAISETLKNVWQESTARPGTLARLSFFQKKFLVGWSTARVAFSMAMGQKVFDMASDAITNQVMKKT